MVRVVSKRPFVSPFQYHAQNKAKLISETRRRFEAEYVTGGYRVLDVEAGVQRRSLTLQRSLQVSLGKGFRDHFDPHTDNALHVPKVFFSIHAIHAAPIGQVIRPLLPKGLM